MESYISKTDIFDHLRVYPRLLYHLLQDLENNAIEGRVLQPTLPALSQRSADRESDDNVVGVLLRAGMVVLSGHVLFTCETRAGAGGEVKAHILSSGFWPGRS